MIELLLYYSMIYGRWSGKIEAGGSIWGVKMEQASARTEKLVFGVLIGSVVMNLITYIFLALEVLPIDAFTLRFAGGFFLLVFVCLHGWYRYGWKTMAVFFLITVAVTWPARSLSIATGIPFGRFFYTDSLGEKSAMCRS